MGLCQVTATKSEASYAAVGDQNPGRGPPEPGLQKVDTWGPPLRRWQQLHVVMSGLALSRPSANVYGRLNDYEHKRKQSVPV